MSARLTVSVRFAVFAGLASITGGCALVAGLSADYAAAESSDGGPGGGDGAGSAASGDGGCGPIVIADDTFATGLTSGWIPGGSTATNAGGATPAVELVPPNEFAYGTLYHAPLNSFTGAFSVSFRFRVDVPGTFTGDGFAFAWLDGNGDVTTASDGQGLGMIERRRGWAFVLDTYQNPDNGDPEAPYYGIVKIDSARGKPGTYDWHVQSTRPLGASVFGVTHTARVTMASGVVSAVVDDAPIFLSVAVETFTGFGPGGPGPGPGGPGGPGAGAIEGNFGFSAATGGTPPLTAYVDNVRVTVPNPACPGEFP